MNRQLALQVADAVLYEGYMLYPYRPSAIKNRQRWSVGILYPPGYPEVNEGTERCVMHSEVLFEGEGKAELQLQLRFLHLLERQVEHFTSQPGAQMTIAQGPDHRPGRFEPVDSLVVGEQRFESWDEGVERSVELEIPSLEEPRKVPFRFAGSSESELLRYGTGQLAGVVRRTQHAVMGTITVVCKSIREGLYKLTMEVENTTPLGLASRDRSSALLRALLSAHTIVSLKNGNFVSLLEPPEALREEVAGCRSTGNFPVLVGEATARDMVLCSPIILYDYPQIAPESANAFYDATEMDEMLTLRVLTLTDEEKDEMRHADDHVRDLLERTTESAREQLMKTHGTIRSLRPVKGKAVNGKQSEKP